MQATEKNTMEKHISFEYTSFDRVVLRGYVQRLFVEGSGKHIVYLGFTNHSNGVMRILTDKLNFHINKNCWKDWCKNTLVGRAIKEIISFENWFRPRPLQEWIDKEKQEK